MPSFDRSNPDASAVHSANQPQQGLEVDGNDAAALAKAIELAVDYRGDVTIERRSTSEQVTGYIFDRRDATNAAEAVIRLIPTDRDERITIACSDIARLVFSGRDTAAGKSFETWMKKYVQRKLAGREASIHSEPLDDTD